MRPFKFRLSHWLEGFWSIEFIVITATAIIIIIIIIIIIKGKVVPVLN
jgi:hypothetical protein